ncbi:helix-turn-helix domain-containing protein [Deinococcus gobiensis]|uniref:HTH cro/C1-type domain-containing protein n=1 Tax=Deinococcus gobiensis (strain DSM 21396 / JCM 16679 / CGMCC 1.7299 / I-0) TaxID=745776 RepID=H8H3V2_DEIGI|nr:helix-turn-helix transcriptional regulator [Deinococcus gobiensis]AFD28199.1 hypothetical protein DGo_PE0055 [Deinococcus gobiensis I-0]
MPLTASVAGERLAAYLKRAQMQQKDLAIHLGIEPSYVSRMVKGHVNWTTGQYFGQIASKLHLLDTEIKELNQAVVIEIATHEGSSQSFRREESDLSEELKKAVEIYKSIDPLIEDLHVQMALAQAGSFKGGPKTTQEWIIYFNDIRNWLKKSS